ncbi:uncharacterized protein LOC108902145 [Lates calcarifer]|uniref:Uncharacterized protein LOC108902145 n=1 Tax=Lates calcarifer TaxID=8187 RepID=A0AAJ8DMF0_LATCA|nr:uncharacterized protein LOC108902145 [Lates calcarifer]
MGMSRHSSSRGEADDVILPDSPTPLCNALLTGNHEDKLLKMRTGEDVTVQCFFTSFGISKFFCKDSCQEKVLVGTAGDRAQRDRYSIRYLTGTRGGSFLFVTITNLTKSDSGQYWCALDSSSLRDFELIVTDASVPSTTTTTDQSDTTTEGVLLYVGLTLVVVFILSSLAVLIICIKRNPTLCGLRTRGNSDATNMEITPYENCPPVSTHEDSTYQSLSPASMDQDQTYSTLTHTTTHMRLCEFRPGICYCDPRFQFVFWP